MSSAIWIILFTVWTGTDMDMRRDQVPFTTHAKCEAYGRTHYGSSFLCVEVQ